MIRHTLLFVMTMILSVSYGYAQNHVIDTLETDRAASISPDQLLKGRVSGVYVQEDNGGLNAIRNALIRGVNSLHGSSAPLWIIDGAIMSSVQDEQLEMFWQDKFAGKTSDQCLSTMDGINLYDIESIEVLKNVSATAIYGELGANGAIIIKTKRQKEGNSIEVRSNFGTSFPGFINNNSVAFSSGNNRSDYRMSVFFRGITSSPFHETNNFGGAAFTLNTKAGSRVDLGLSARVSLGKQNSTIPEDWRTDYDDLCQNIRTTDNFYFNLKIIEGLYWRNNLSADYQVNSRNTWYGLGTPFGKEVNKAAGISVASKLFATVNSSFEYTVQQLVNHKLSVSAGGQVYYSDTKFNTLNGTNILISQLKALGFGYRESADDAALYRKCLPQFGLYGKVSYAYKKYAGLELLSRFDRTVRYEDQWIWYPSATAFVDFKELFLADSRLVSDLRLDVGYGRAGNNRYVPYYMFPKYTDAHIPSFPRDAEAFLDGWQNVISHEFNVGVHTGFLDGRVNVSARWYSKKTDDVLTLFQFGQLDEKSQLWKYTPRFVSSEYAGLVTNDGVETDIDALILDLQSFKWNLGFNVAYNKTNLNILFPSVWGGLSTTFRFYGVTVDALADGAAGYADDRDFLRLSRLSVGYDIPLPKVKWINGLNVYAVASNTASWTHYVGTYPVMKSIVFGVKADF